MSLFRVDHLSAGYGGAMILKDVSFSVPRGSITGVLGANGSAYIDPSVMTYLIQAVAGVVVAVGAVVGLYWRRAKKKVSQTLGVDENRNKEVESDEIIVNTDAE